MFSGNGTMNPVWYRFFTGVSKRLGVSTTDLIESAKEEAEQAVSVAQQAAELAAEAVQSGDNVSDLVNDAGYLTSVLWGDIGGTLADQTDLQTVLDAKEDAFSKNTAFNKNFGTIAGTVVEGSQLANYQLLSEKGQPNGYAELDGGGKIPAGQLPSYVDDVEEYADFASFPATGEAGKIYIDLAESDIYRWTGTAYAKINDAVSQADQSLKWSSPITLTLTGDASGNVAFDGSGNVTLNVTVSDDSHNHIIGNVDGLQTALDGKLSTSATTDDVSEGASNLYFTNTRSRSAISVSGDLSYDSGTGVISFSETYSTPTELLDSIKTVDGSGSGLDADTLDGLDSTQFVRSDASDTLSGLYTFYTTTSSAPIRIRDSADNGTEAAVWMQFQQADGGQLGYFGFASSSTNSMYLFNGVGNVRLFDTGSEKFRTESFGTRTIGDHVIESKLDVGGIGTENNIASFVSSISGVRGITLETTAVDGSAPFLSWLTQDGSTFRMRMTPSGDLALGTGFFNQLWTFAANGVLSGNGAGLTNVDAATLDSLDSTAFLKINSTNLNAGFFHIHRSSTNASLFINQSGTGDIARFFKGTAQSDISGANQVTITNSGGITATGEVTAATLSAGDGASGSFTTTDGKTVTVNDGIITGIV